MVTSKATEINEIIGKILLSAKWDLNWSETKSLSIPLKISTFLAKLFLPTTYLRQMQIQVLKSKIHRVTVTEADLNYIGSLTIDEDLMDAANLIENEKIHVVNVNNGERLETYVLKGGRGTGVICLNGPAARKGTRGDVIIILSYAQMDFEEAKTFKPWLLFPGEGNRLV